MKMFYFTETIEGKQMESGFRLDLVTRTVVMEDGAMIVFLGDWHYEYQAIEIPTKNGGKRIENRDMHVCSRIMVPKEEVQRLKECLA